jgi:hypothetical protein
LKSTAKHELHFSTWRVARMSALRAMPFQ